MERNTCLPKQPKKGNSQLLINQSPRSYLPGFYVAPGATLAFGTRGYEVQWEFDHNGDAFDLVAIEFEEDPASGNSYKAKVRHPVTQGVPLLIVELQGQDGQTGLRIGGPTGPASEKLLTAVLSDSWAWSPGIDRLVAFKEWAKEGKPSWAFVAEMTAKTNPPTAQPVLCLHTPKDEVVARDGANLARAWQRLLPIPPSANDSLVRASKDLAMILELPLTSDMVSIWNAGFSRPRLLSFQPSRVFDRLTRACVEVGLPVSRVRTETELPVW